MSPSALRRQVGHLLIAGFNGQQLPVELVTLAREFGLGGVILFARNIADPDQVAELCFDELHERIGLVGHSHVALSFERQEGSPATGSARREDETVDISAGNWLLNPGSVGQPRDGDPRAAWLMLDLTSGLASWHRTEYDIDGAAAAIRAARLPDSLAERLQYGQ